MVCYNHNTVVKSLIERLCAVKIGPYKVEYINNAGKYRNTENEYLAILERKGGVIDIVDIESKFFKSIVEEYGAKGIEENY